MVSFDKLLHLIVGIVVGIGFWQLIERFSPIATRRINPIVFILFLIWGASGLFFFRKLHIPILSGDLFYMAVPDWDIPLYQWTRWRLLIHRSWMFHSILIPTGLLCLCGWQIYQQRYNWLWKGLQEASIALSVGMAAHLLWDALLSSTKRGFFIHGWNQTASFAWLMLNLLLGIAIPFGVIWLMNPSTNSD